MQEWRLDRQEVCPAKKETCPSSFVLSDRRGEERDGSPQDALEGGGHVCVLNVLMPVGEEKKCKKAKLNLYISYSLFSIYLILR